MNLFVTVGTMEFDDLIREMDKYVYRSGDKIIFQIGFEGRYVPSHGRYFRAKSDISKELEGAEVVISHGGGGTILEALALGKKVIAVANPKMKQRHQEDLVDHLAAEGFIIKGTLGKLEKALGSKKKLKPYVRPECTIHKKLKL